MITRYTLISIPKSFWKTLTFKIYLIIIKTFWAVLTFKGTWVIISVFRAGNAFLTIKYWNLIRTIHAFLSRDIIYLIYWTLFTCFRYLIEIVWMNTRYTRVSCPKLLLRGTLALFYFLIVYSSKGTALTIKTYITIKFSFLTFNTALSIEIRNFCWTIYAFILIYIIHLLIGTKNTIHFLTIKIFRIIAWNTIFSSPKLFFWRANTFFFNLVIYSILRTLLTL